MEIDREGNCYQQGVFYMQNHTGRIARNMTFVIPVVKQKIAQWVHHKGLIQ